MAVHPLMNKIVDAGIALAYSGKGAGIAGVWAEFLRQHVRVVSGEQPPHKQTWSVDGQAMWVNADFSAGLSSEELQFLIAHETMHIALDHVARARDVGANTPELHRLLNIAEDAVINQALIDDGIGRMLAGDKRGVVLSDFVAKGYTGPRDSLVLYEWLQQNSKAAPPPPKGGGNEQGEGEALKGCSPSGTPGDEPVPGEGDAEGAPGEGQAPGGESARVKAKIRAERARATLTEASQKAGGGTAIAELLSPRPTRASVRQLIRRGFEKASVNALNRVRPSFSRAGRRSVDDMIVTAGKIGTEAFIAFAGDVSGSMTDEGRATLIGFIESTAREFPDVRVFLVTHTSEVVWKGWMKAGGDLGAAKAATGFSGGTDFKPAYDAVRDAGKKFDALVHFTDGYNAREWPECPARELIIGLWGSGHGMTPPPAGAKTIPVAAVEGDM